MATIDHDGRTTAYRVVDGAAPPVLFVHGSGGTGRVWAGQRRLDRTVVTLDLSGHGHSTDVDAAPGRPTLSAYVADVLAVRDATGARALCGNSLGGAVVLAAVLEADPPVDAAVIAGGGATLPVADFLLAWLRDDFDRAVEFLHGPDRLFHDPPDRVRERSAAAMRAVGRRVTERDFLTCDDFDVADRLSAVSVPLLALTGEHDALTPPARHEALAAAVPDGRWETVPGAAHLSMLERPSAFGDALEGFLRDVV
ncbi:MAG: alpha/beta fold hydrolase [Halobacteriaceae archaeon]